VEQGILYKNVSDFKQFYINVNIDCSEILTISKHISLCVRKSEQNLIETIYYI